MFVSFGASIEEGEGHLGKYIGVTKVLLEMDKIRHYSTRPTQKPRLMYDKKNKNMLQYRIIERIGFKLGQFWWENREPWSGNILSNRVCM